MHYGKNKKFILIKKHGSLFFRPPQQLDSKKTIFVGNLHGTMTARYLWRLMEDLFGGAVYAGVDIDKYKYP
jgi:cytoplasmic polyadenylation element-binding protein